MSSSLLVASSPVVLAKWPVVIEPRGLVIVDGECHGRWGLEVEREFMSIR